MESNYADVFNPRDNLYPNDASSVSELYQSVLYSPSSDRYYSSYIPSGSFDFPLNSSGFSPNNSALVTDIQSSASNNVLLSPSHPGFPDVGSQYFPDEWRTSYPPQALDLCWDFSTMDDIVPGHYESAQDAEQTFLDGNKTLNVNIHGSSGPKPDKHNRPYVCSHRSCNRKNFSNKSGLERHKREVHSSQNFTCPIRSCDRSKKGFHRRHNLREHQRRVHGIWSSNSPRARSINLGELSDSEESTPSHSYEIEAKGASQDTEVADAMPTSREDLKIRLRGLRAMREKIDGDIKSMERVLSIMGGEY